MASASFLPCLLQRELGQWPTPLSEEHAFSRCPSLWGRMGLNTILHGHAGCVNHVQFNEAGTLLGSGSDDKYLNLYNLNGEAAPILHLKTGHSANIFCVKFMPCTGDRWVATCAGDGLVLLHDVEQGARQVLHHHQGRAKKLVTVEGDPHTLLSCSESGHVLQLDRRSPAAPHLVAKVAAGGMALSVHSIASPRWKPWLLAAGAEDNNLRVYDLRMAASNGAGGGSGGGGGGGGVNAQSRGSARVLLAFQPRGPPGTRVSFAGISGVSCSADGRHVAANYMGGPVGLWALDRGWDPQQQQQQQWQCSSSTTPATRRLRPDAGATSAAAGASGDPAAAGGAGVGGGGSSRRSGGWGPAVETEEAAGPEGRVTLSIDEVFERLESNTLIIPTDRRSLVARSLLTRSGHLFEVGQIEVALRYARWAAQLQPGLGRAHHQVMCCCEAQHDAVGALAAATAALDCSWSQELEDSARRLRQLVAAGAGGGGGGGAGGGGGGGGGPSGSGLGRHAAQQSPQQPGEGDGQAAAVAAGAAASPQPAAQHPQHQQHHHRHQHQHQAGGRVVDGAAQSPSEDAAPARPQQQRLRRGRSAAQQDHQQHQQQHQQQQGPPQQVSGAPDAMEVDGAPSVDGPPAPPVGGAPWTGPGQAGAGTAAAADGAGGAGCGGITANSPQHDRKRQRRSQPGQQQQQQPLLAAAAEGEGAPQQPQPALQQQQGQQQPQQQYVLHGLLEEDHVTPSGTPATTSSSGGTSDNPPVFGSEFEFDSDSQDEPWGPEGSSNTSSSSSGEAHGGRGGPGRQGDDDSDSSNSRSSRSSGDGSNPGESGSAGGAAAGSSMDDSSGSDSSASSGGGGGGGGGQGPHLAGMLHSGGSSDDSSDDSSDSSDDSGDDSEVLEGLSDLMDTSSGDTGDDDSGGDTGDAGDGTSGDTGDSIEGHNLWRAELAGAIAQWAGGGAVYPAGSDEEDEEEEEEGSGEDAWSDGWYEVLMGLDTSQDRYIDRPRHDWGHHAPPGMPWGWCGGRWRQYQIQHQQQHPQHQERQEQQGRRQYQQERQQQQQQQQEEVEEQAPSNHQAQQPQQQQQQQQQPQQQQQQPADQQLQQRQPGVEAEYELLNILRCGVLEVYHGDAAKFLSAVGLAIATGTLPLQAALELRGQLMGGDSPVHLVAALLRQQNPSAAMDINPQQGPEFQRELVHWGLLTKAGRSGRLVATAGSEWYWEQLGVLQGRRQQELQVRAALMGAIAAGRSEGQTAAAAGPEEQGRQAGPADQQQQQGEDGQAPSAPEVPPAAAAAAAPDEESPGHSSSTSRSGSDSSVDGLSAGGGGGAAGQAAADLAALQAAVRGLNRTHHLSLATRGSCPAASFDWLQQLLGGCRLEDHHHQQQQQDKVQREESEQQMDGAAGPAPITAAAAVGDEICTPMQPQQHHMDVEEEQQQQADDPAAGAPAPRPPPAATTSSSWQDYGLPHPWRRPAVTAARSPTVAGPSAPGWLQWGAGGPGHAGHAGRAPCDWQYYLGAEHEMTIKDVSFVGPDEQLVAAGSDCGRLLLWDRYTGRLVNVLRADHVGAVNVVAGHPHQPLLASCGLDRTVKLWSPCRLVGQQEQQEEWPYATLVALAGNVMGLHH